MFKSIKKLIKIPVYATCLISLGSLQEFSLIGTFRCCSIEQYLTVLGHKNVPTAEKGVHIY